MVNPKYWGLSGWRFIFFIASSILYNPESKEDIEKFKQIYNHVVDIIPCTVCKKHMKDLMLANNFYSMADGYKIRRFLMFVYNSTNPKNIISHWEQHQDVLNR